MKANEKLIEEMSKFDDAFPDGIFAVPRNLNEPRVKVRALLDYCRERGLQSIQLSPEEMEQFLEY